MFITIPTSSYHNRPVVLIGNLIRLIVKTWFINVSICPDARIDEVTVRFTGCRTAHPRLGASSDSGNPSRGVSLSTASHELTF